MSIETVTFRIGTYLFGVPIFLAKEVSRIEQEKDLVRVPGSSPMFMGLLNLRGQVVTVLNPSYWFSSPEKDYIHVSGYLELLIFKSREDVEKSGVQVSLSDYALLKDLVALPVSSVGEIIELEEEMIRPLPVTSHQIQSEILQGIVSIDNETLYLFNFKSWLEIIMSKRYNT